MDTIGDTPAEHAWNDQLDAAVRDAMGMPFGGMFNLNVDGVALPFLDAAGAVGVVRVSSQGSDSYRTCTACTDPERCGDQEAECGHQAELTVRYDFTTEHACSRDRAEMLAALRPMVINDDHQLG